MKEIKGLRPKFDIRFNVIGFVQDLKLDYTFRIFIRTISERLAEFINYYYKLRIKYTPLKSIHRPLIRKTFDP